MWAWLAILALFTMDPAPARCLGPVAPAVARQQAAAVFSATVVGREWVAEPYAAQYIGGVRADRWADDQFAPGEERMVRRLWIDLAVHRVWKGRITSRVRMETSVLRFPRGAGQGPDDNEFDFRDGGTYLVYADGPGGTRGPLRASVCSRTRPLDGAAEDLRSLGRGRPPRRS